MGGVRRVLLGADRSAVGCSGAGSARCDDGDTIAAYACAAAPRGRRDGPHGHASTSARSCGRRRGCTCRRFLRANLLAAQVASGGPKAGQPVGSAGEAVTHFRDDAEDVANVRRRAGRRVRRHRVHGDGRVRARQRRRACGSGADRCRCSASHSPRATLDRRIKRTARPIAPRHGAVSGFLGDVMAAATTVKVNDAIGPVDPLGCRSWSTGAAHRRARPRARRGRAGVQPGRGRRRAGARAARQRRRDRVGRVRRRPARGVHRVPRLAQLPAADGRAGARPPQAGGRRVRPDERAGRRRARRQHGAPASTCRSARRGSAPTRLARTRRDRRCASSRVERPRRACYASGAGVRRRVVLDPERGSFTVVTGPIGSGKSTLLRALLGLAHDAEVAGDGAVERRSPSTIRAVVPRPAERGVPAAGAAADLRLGRRQHRPRRHGGRGDRPSRSSWPWSAATSQRCPTGLDTLIGPRGPAPVGRSASTRRHGACAGAPAGAGGARRPVERARRRDRAGPVGQPRRRRA